MFCGKIIPQNNLSNKKIIQKNYISSNNFNNANECGICLCINMQRAYLDDVVIYSDSWGQQVKVISGTESN